MPQAINLVIKNGASTPVDKTFALITPAAGYGGIAEWRLKEGGAEVAFPMVTHTARDITTTQRRKCQLKLRLPAVYADPTTGQPTLLSAAEANVEISMPHSFPEAQKADFAAYLKNVVSHALMTGTDGALKDATPLT